MKAYKRPERVAQLIRREIGSMLLTGGGPGERFARVVVTDCRVSPDIRVAHVYYTILGDEDRDGAMTRARQDLDGARKALRRGLGQVLRTKYTPELFFHYDETLERARRIEDVLRTLRHGESEDSES